jgi:hypothetical protein
LHRYGGWRAGHAADRPGAYRSRREQRPAPGHVRGRAERARRPDPRP